VLFAILLLHVCCHDCCGIEGAGLRPKGRE
jgi:hypothetical protein